jgi:hypothetical protein
LAPRDFDATAFALSIGQRTAASINRPATGGRMTAEYFAANAAPNATPQIIARARLDD